MLSNIADDLDLSVAAVVAIGVLLLVQLGLQIAALVDLVRQPAQNVRPGKLVWALVILFGNLLGTVLYFALGRHFPATVAEPPVAESTEQRAKATADLLYGPDDQQ